MTDRRVVIVGAGGHAKVVTDVIRLSGSLKIVGYLDEINEDRWGTEFYGRPILGGLEQLPLLSDRGIRQAFIAVGDCGARLRLASVAKDAGFALATFRHPQSIVASDVQLGEGTVIVGGAVVNPGSDVGAHVIVNTAASVDHDCHIEDGVHICPGAHLAGRVTVGRGAWIGIGSVVSDGVIIGPGSTIGAGALVLQNIPAGVVAFGSPARIIRSVEEGDLARR